MGAREKEEKERAEKKKKKKKRKQKKLRRSKRKLNLNKRSLHSQLNNSMKVVVGKQLLEKEEINEKQLVVLVVILLFKLKANQMFRLGQLSKKYWSSVPNLLILKLLMK